MKGVTFENINWAKSIGLLDDYLRTRMTYWNIIFEIIESSFTSPKACLYLKTKSWELTRTRPSKMGI